MVAKRPNSKRNLDMALRRIGGVDEDYVRRRTVVANAIVASMMPDGAVKGGSAMKIRFGDAATRASTDLDAARATSLEIFVGKLEDALVEQIGNYVFCVVSGNTDAIQTILDKYNMGESFCYCD